MAAPSVGTVRNAAGPYSECQGRWERRSVAGCCFDWVWILSVLREQKLQLNWMEHMVNSCCVSGMGVLRHRWMGFVVYVRKWSLEVRLASFTLLPTYPRTYGVSQGGNHCKSDTRSLYWVPYLRKGGQDVCPSDCLGFNTCPPVKATPSRLWQRCFLGCQFKSGGCVYTRNFHIWGPGL